MRAFGGVVIVLLACGGQTFATRAAPPDYKVVWQPMGMEDAVWRSQTNASTDLGYYAGTPLLSHDGALHQRPPDVRPRRRARRAVIISG